VTRTAHVADGLAHAVLDHLQGLDGIAGGERIRERLDRQTRPWSDDPDRCLDQRAKRRGLARLDRRGRNVRPAVVVSSTVVSQ